MPKLRLEMARYHQERRRAASAGHVGRPDGARAAERPYRAQFGRSKPHRRRPNVDVRPNVAVAAFWVGAKIKQTVWERVGLAQGYGARSTPDDVEEAPRQDCDQVFT